MENTLTPRQKTILGSLICAFFLIDFLGYIISYIIPFLTGNDIELHVKIHTIGFTAFNFISIILIIAIALQKNGFSFGLGRIAGIVMVLFLLFFMVSRILNLFDINLTKFLWIFRDFVPSVIFYFFTVIFFMSTRLWIFPKLTIVLVYLLEIVSSSVIVAWHYNAEKGNFEILQTLSQISGLINILINICIIATIVLTAVWMFKKPAAAKSVTQ